MKSKFIFIVLLLSFVLHISHDILIAKELIVSETTLSKKSISNSEEPLCCKSCETHEAFHFSAILLNTETTLSYLLKKVHFSINTIYLNSINKRTFKPPIA